jgi:hypothetical protein
MPKKRKRTLKSAQLELVALLEYMLSEVHAGGEEKHYRLRIPYGTDERNKVELIADVSVYCDGELEDDRDDRKKFKLTGPYKKRH